MAGDNPPQSAPPTPPSEVPASVPVPPEAQASETAQESSALPAPPPADPATAQPPAETAQEQANEPLAVQPEPIALPQPAAAAAPSQIARDNARRSVDSRQSRARKKLEKILALVAKIGAVGNDDVEKLLHVSDATATRYLAQLVHEGRLRKVGRIGAAVRYEKA